MTSTLPQLNVIACQRCRQKKLRCDREKPTCKRCRLRSFDCLYEAPRYGKRKGVAVPGPIIHGSAAATSPDISGLVSRIEALERAAGSTSTSANSSNPSPRDSQRNHDYDHHIDARNPSAKRTNLRGFRFRLDPLLSASDEKVFIPLETAVSWVHAFYDSQSTLGLILPIGKDFMLTIPTILGSPYVQVDIRVVILYYGALHEGMRLDHVLSASDKNKYSLYFYRKALQYMEEWQRQDQVNELSLHVAFWMTYQARFQLDFDLSYHLHIRACQISRDLGLLDLDTDATVPPRPPPDSSRTSASPSAPTETPRPADTMDTVYRDVHRIFFWHILIADDHLFRHHLYRPGSIDMGTWKVAVPDLSARRHLSDIKKDTRIYFEASLRLSLIELKFSELLESSRSWPTSSAGFSLSEAGQVAIQDLLMEVDSVLSEWQIEQLLCQVSSKVNAYLYAQLIWRATSMITSFLRISPRNTSWPKEQDKALEHKAAHRSISAMRSLLAVDQDGLYRNLGCFKSFMTPCLGILFGNIFATPSEQSAATDLALTSWVQTIVTECAAERPELKSLELFLLTLNAYAHLSFGQRFSSPETFARTRACDWQNTPGRSVDSSSIVPQYTATGSLSREEEETLGARGISVADLYNDPYQALSVLERSLLTEPDPHCHWWTFDS
ncbi:hypothetical protein BJY01DRAFT_216484 [Aspergillus pseudoustus]|uniref:Zn(2)-C6 fungal-type domain-containing protein n=1 Tax=Aspergillus pseudoustus TaxID=1810923 RepID=A0ABR4JQT5_9EURO